MTYVAVTWLDAHCKLDSISRDDADALTPVETVTVGHLVSQSPVGVVVAVDAYPGDPDHFGNWHFVPSGMVVSVTELKASG